METAFEYRDFVEGSDFWVRFHNCKSENLWPLRAKWRWLDSECKLREKVVEWQFPFDFEEHVEKFFDAGLTADYSQLPNPILAKSERSGYVDVHGILSRNLGLTLQEIEKAISIGIEDLPNGWEFVIRSRMLSGNNMKWLANGLGHDRTIERRGEGSSY